MFRSRERVIIHGAGLAGRRTFQCVRHRCEVVAFSDNDARKHGSRLFRRPVIPPSEIPAFSVRKVLVASIHAPEITLQLLRDVKLDPACIETVRKDILAGEYEVSKWTLVVVGLLAVLAIATAAAAVWMLIGRS